MAACHNLGTWLTMMAALTFTSRAFRSYIYIYIYIGRRPWGIP